MKKKIERKPVGLGGGWFVVCEEIEIKKNFVDIMLHKKCGFWSITLVVSRKLFGNFVFVVFVYVHFICK